jgi:hypothetical protein
MQATFGLKTLNKVVLQVAIQVGNTKRPALPLLGLVIACLSVRLPVPNSAPIHPSQE